MRFFQWLVSFFRKPPVTTPETGPFRITLIRDPDDGVRTFGVLTAGPLTFQTLEPPDKGNQHKISSIPKGVYPLKLHLWDHEPEKGTQVYEVVGVVGNDGLSREPIDIHPGNLVHETLGCVMIADHRGALKGEPAIVNDSFRSGFTAFMGFMSTHPQAEIAIV